MSIHNTFFLRRNKHNFHLETCQLLFISHGINYHIVWEMLKTSFIKHMQTVKAVK